MFSFASACVVRPRPASIGSMANRFAHFIRRGPTTRCNVSTRWCCWAGNRIHLRVSHQIQNLAAIHHVAAIPQFFGFDPHSLFSVWLPTEAELASFRRAHSFVDCRILTAAFTASLKTSVYARADAMASSRRSPTATWSTARAALASAIERSTLVRVWVRPASHLKNSNVHFRNGCCGRSKLPPAKPVWRHICRSSRQNLRHSGMTTSDWCMRHSA